MGEGGIFRPVTHNGIYSLSLSQERNKMAFYLNLELGESKQPIEFMIDTGKNLLLFFQTERGKFIGFR